MNKFLLVLFILIAPIYSQTMVLPPVGTYPSLVKFQWDASPDINVIGYKLYFGFTTGNYTYEVDCGNNLNYDAVGVLETDKTYFVAATAYNNLGLESDFSNEISVLVKPQTLNKPSPPQNLRKF